MKKHELVTKLKPIIICEGCRNVGKSFLINTIKDLYLTYKYPFNEWFINVYDNDMTNNINKEIFYLIFGQDSCLFDMYNKGLIKDQLVLDRGFLSNIVFGIQSKRITLEEAIKNLKWQLEKWPELFKIVYITSKNTEDLRDKDKWSIYNSEETDKIYRHLFKELNIEPIEFFNNKDKESEIKFFDTLKKLS